MNLPADSLKKAIERGEFEEADCLIEAFGKAVKSALRSAASEAERLAIVNEAAAFLQDRLHLARVMRAHIVSKLSIVSRLSSYGYSSGARSTWNFEG